MQPGDANAIARLVEQNGSALVLYARTLCDCPDDMVQEAFMRLIRQPELPEQPKAWLFRVVRNLALNSNRGTGRRRHHEQSRARTSQAWFEPRPDSRIAAGEAIDALGELEPEQRETVVARIWGQLTFDQIAELTGCSISTTHRRYQTALSHLKDRLDQNPDETSHQIDLNQK